MVRYRKGRRTFKRTKHCILKMVPEEEKDEEKGEEKEKCC